MFSVSPGSIVYFLTMDWTKCECASLFNSIPYLIIQFRISEIQSRLFDLGAAIATPVANSSEEKINYTKVATALFFSVNPRGDIPTSFLQRT